MGDKDTPQTPYVPPRARQTDFPLIDSDPHLFRVLGYMRPSDYAFGTTVAAANPAAFYLIEKISPSHVGRGGFAPGMRLIIGLGLGAGFLASYTRSYLRFLGLSENKREIDLDMREMVAKVKRGEPPYGKSELTEHHQGMAARNSRNSGFGLFILPFFNIVNHPHHGVDTAKYYQQAERELEAERIAKEGK